MQHLRRFAKEKDVPKTVQEAFDNLTKGEPVDEDPDKVHIVNDAQDASTITTAELFLIVGSTNVLPEQAVLDGLANSVSSPLIVTLPVPLLAPTTAEQAKLWSSKYWPTVYKKSNPFGPHVSLMTRTADEISQDIHKWMGLAEAAAQKVRSSSYGEAVGVVVVERRNGVARPIAVAGDGRWNDWPCSSGPGNVTAHAVMRAIGMVAEGLKEREFRDGLAIPPPASLNQEIFQDKPSSDVERENYDTTNNESGYLCFDLEIYCTHEPCVMCSMAIIHSRFGKLVFGERMKQTGGITADEDGLGCGLWWRKELNWTMLAWQYIPDGVPDKKASDLELHA
jgi:tRNA-specific adenosine deaminase 3